MSWYQWRGDTLLLDLRIQPRASRDRIAGPLGERLKVTITAPPVDGKANACLCRYLGKAFGLPTSRVSVVAGQTGRNKRVSLDAPGKIPPELQEFITL